MSRLDISVVLGRSGHEAGRSRYDSRRGVSRDCQYCAFRSASGLGLISAQATLSIAAAKNVNHHLFAGVQARCA